MRGGLAVGCNKRSEQARNWSGVDWMGWSGMELGGVKWRAWVEVECKAVEWIGVGWGGEAFTMVT